MRGWWLVGVVACGSGPEVVDADGDGAIASADCDDGDARRAPGLAEICDGVDNDCDGLVDAYDTDSPPPDLIRIYMDGDGDGYGTVESEILACQELPGFTVEPGDCNDADRDRAPGLSERCDGFDNDCDGLVDDADVDTPPTDRRTLYVDGDRDGVGDAEILACGASDGVVEIDGDCDDTDPARRPGIDEVCDGIDNDCDGLVDDDDADSPPTDPLPWFPDSDQDGFGDVARVVMACAAPAGHIADGTDCDDSTAARAPGLDERCDGLDNDCDTWVDDDDPDSAPVDPLVWYADRDRDGFGDLGAAALACVAPPAHVVDSTDCDDSTAMRAPGLAEVCDALDNDCDTLVDDADLNSPPVDAPTWYLDGDGDGAGNPSTGVTACVSPLPGRVDVGGDCDDTEPKRAPTLPEAPCDGLDNDCDTVIDTNVVPRDFATLQDAVDALPPFTPSPICVEAGVHTGPVTLASHAVTIVSREGPVATTLDLSGLTGPFVTATGNSTLAIDGFTVVGLDNAQGAATFAGAFVDLARPSPGLGTDVELRDIVFDAPRVEVDDEVTGGIVRLENANVQLVDIDVFDLSMDLDAVIVGLRGAVLSSFGGDVTVERLTVADPVLSTGPSAGACFVQGLIIYATGGSVTTVNDLDVSGGSFTLDCTLETYVNGALLHLRDGAVEGARWTLTDNVLGIVSPSGLGYGLVWIDGASLDLDASRLARNAIGVDGTTLSAVTGMLTLGPSTNEVRITDLVAHANASMAQGPFGSGGYGSVVTSNSSRPMELSAVDLRDNTTSANLTFGGAVYTLSADLLVEDSVFAANRAGLPSGSEAYGAAIYLRLSATSGVGAFEARHVDFVGQRGEATNVARGGAIFAATEGATLIEELEHVNLAFNSVSAAAASGSAYETFGAPLLGYSNTFGNVGAEPFSQPPVDLGGNLTVDPEHVDVSSPDPLRWDLRLQPSSPLIDAGDPTRTDPDGTPPDIGSYGGPLALP